MHTVGSSKHPDSLIALEQLEPVIPPKHMDQMIKGNHRGHTTSSKKAHVLLVDDDQEITRAVKARLRKSGYAVTTAFNGEAGLRSALENAPDAVILDVRMPLMDGLTMLTEMRRAYRTRNIPVILLSAFMREEDKRAALCLGASYFIEKPYDSLVLVEAVERAVADHPGK